LTTLLWQTTSALPLSYFLADPASLFTGLLGVKTLMTFVGSASTVFLFAGVFISVSRSLRNGLTGDGRPAIFPARLLLLMGLALIVLPALLVSVCVKYQRWITPGKGYILVYIEYYGVALVFATAAWEGFSRLAAGGFRSRWPRLLMACLIAAVATLTYQANIRVAKALVIPPGAPDFNPNAGAMLGCYHNHRLNLEAALRAGLVAEVPDRSLVFLANEYHWWYEWEHASQFYAMHSSKKLTAVPLVNTWLGALPPIMENLLASAGSTRPFLVRDVSLGAKAGYVVLSHYRAESGDEPSRPHEDSGRGELKVFVRHPKLFAYGPTPALVLLGCGFRSPAKAQGLEPVPEFARWGRDVTILKSGSDWVLISLRSDVGRVDPDSLKVAIGPVPPEWEDGGSVTADWSDGFYPLEIGPLLRWRWRWCSRRGVLTLNNHAEVPRKITISMRLQGTGDAPLVFVGDSLTAEVKPGIQPVRFERELTLSPGSHRIAISTEGSVYTARVQDARTVYFRVVNFAIRDSGGVEVERTATRPAASSTR
jgi:hypothetical protein